MLELHSHTTGLEELVNEALTIAKFIATGAPARIDSDMVLELIDREEALLLEVSESELLKQIPNGGEIHSNLATALIISQFIASGIPSRIDTDMVLDLVDHMESLLSTVNETLKPTGRNQQKENDDE
ncbi:hypothetical protein FG071_19095 [Vibrio cholerae]|uniref:hypothetical protein n=1 Tax=Vibrio cholerae TaxID=666 RepID=UPI003080DC89|nr:hypothetical protein [Vibrio cholerae]